MKNYIRIIQLKAMKKSTELLMRFNPILDFEELGQYMYLTMKLEQEQNSGFQRIKKLFKKLKL
jgi:hypothetical protein